MIPLVPLYTRENPSFSIPGCGESRPRNRKFPRCILATRLRRDRCHSLSNQISLLFHSINFSIFFPAVFFTFLSSTLYLFPDTARIPRETARNCNVQFPRTKRTRRQQRKFFHVFSVCTDGEIRRGKQLIIITKRCPLFYRFAADSAFRSLQRVVDGSTSY